MSHERNKHTPSNAVRGYDAILKEIIKNLDEDKENGG